MYRSNYFERGKISYKIYIVRQAEFWAQFWPFPSPLTSLSQEKKKKKADLEKAYRGQQEWSRSIEHFSIHGLI